MLGIIFAAAVAAWNYLIVHLSPEGSFLAATNVLWWWQIILTGISALLILLMMLGITSATTVAGGVAGRWAGGFAGFAVGGFMSLIMFVGFALTRCMMLGGTWLLMHAGTPDERFSQFDQTKLVFGAGLLILGLLMSRIKFSASVTRSESYS